MDGANHTQNREVKIVNKLKKKVQAFQYQEKKTKENN